MSNAELPIRAEVQIPDQNISSGAKLIKQTNAEARYASAARA